MPKTHIKQRVCSLPRRARRPRRAQTSAPTARPSEKLENPWKYDHLGPGFFCKKIRVPGFPCRKIRARNHWFSNSFRNYSQLRTVALAVEMRTGRAGSGDLESNPRRNADDRNCGNDMFHNVFQAFSVNYQKMRSVGIWAPRGDGTAPRRIREPMVFQWFSMILERSQHYLSQTEAARGEGTGRMQSIRIAKRLCWEKIYPVPDREAAASQRMLSSCQWFLNLSTKL